MTDASLPQPIPETPKDTRPSMLWEYPDLRQTFCTSVERSLTLLQRKLEHDFAATKVASWGVLIMTGIIVSMIVVPVTWLTANGKLSADAATFVFGVLVGAAFAFLRDFFPKS